MSRTQTTIERCASGKSKSFTVILDKVTKTFPGRNYKWCIGVAVHIQCMRESRGGWEYLQVSERGQGNSLAERDINQTSVATIQTASIHNKYLRYVGYQRAN